MELFHYLNLFTVWMIRQGGYLGIAIAMALESFMIPIPSEVILPFGGYLAAAGKLSVVGVTLAGAIGGTVGSVALYCISVLWGNVFVKKFGKYVFLSEEHVKITQRWFEKYGAFAVFTTRLLPVVRGMISIPAGIAKMNSWSFTISTFIGTLLWSLILTYFGFQLGLSNASPEMIWLTTLAVAAVAVMIYFGTRFVKKHIKTLGVAINVSLWMLLAFFIFYGLYESYSPLPARDLNYRNALKLQKTSNISAFCVIGNTFKNLKVLNEISHLSNVSFVLSLGNMVYSGDRAKYRLLIREIRNYDRPFLLIPGPRELRDGGYQNYYTFFGSYDYAFKAGKLCFVMLNDANARITGQQLNWLSRELSDFSSCTYRVVAMNVPPSWTKIKGKTLDRETSFKLGRTFEVHNVNLLLSTGYPATVSTSSFLTYAIVGGRNYLFVDLKNHSMKIKKFHFGNPDIFIEAFSVYLYSFLVLEWPVIGIVSMAVLIIWFLLKRYKFVVKIERKK